MKFYLVGLLDSYSYTAIESLQLELSEKYDLYTKLPKLHLTLEVIDSPNVDELHNILKDILANLQKFWVKASGAICFEAPFKSVNLSILNEGTVHDLILDINRTLKSNGFNVRDDLDSWDLHISLANPYFSDREWSKVEYAEACELIKSQNFKRNLLINKIELWKPINDESKMVIGEYNLK